MPASPPPPLMASPIDNPRRICLIGVFPPPVHGVSFVNAQMRRLVEARGIEPDVINLSNATLDRGLGARLARTQRIRAGLRTFRRLVAGHQRLAVYMSVSGGWGQLYECAFCWLARRADAQLVLHHNSYAYLNRPSWLTRLLVGVAGPDATHIVLSPDMGERLRGHYNGARRVRPLSNAAFIDAGPATARQELHTLGFLGNITPEKGILEFLDVQAATGLRALVAGPFMSPEIEAAIRARLAGVEYVGPKYGDEKRKFFDEIDVLLFPSKYSNEAEPLTVLEAMAHGVPVIAWQRGCLDDVVGQSAGVVVEAGQDFVPAATEQIRRWIAMPDSFATASRGAAERYTELRRDATRSLDELLREIGD